jgi:hypothetical protein
MVGFCWVQMAMEEREGRLRLAHLPNVMILVAFGKGNTEAGRSAHTTAVSIYH